MNRLLLTLVAFTLLAAPSLAQAQGYVYHVFGSFCSSCFNPTSVNQLYDDGLHDDGAAGDGVFGAFITIDKPAGRYGWLYAVEYGFGGEPSCWCSPTLVGAAQLWTTGPGDVVHFHYRGSPPGPGWGGQAVACDHGVPPGAQLEVAFPLWYDENPPTGYPAYRVGTYWQQVITVPVPGTQPMMFRTLDRSVLYSDTYNAWCGCSPGEQRFVMFTTVQPNSDVLFQFDEVTGRQRAIELGPTPVRTTSWGQIKTLYR